MQHVINTPYGDRHTFAREDLETARADLADPAVRADPRVVKGCAEAITRAEAELAQPNWTLAEPVGGGPRVKVLVEGPGLTYAQITQGLVDLIGQAVRQDVDADQFFDRTMTEVVRFLRLPPTFADRVAVAIADNPASVTAE